MGLALEWLRERSFGKFKGISCRCLALRYTSLETHLEIMLNESQNRSLVVDVVFGQNFLNDI